VAPDSPADLEARARATSVYLADRVVPMLPEVLSNHVCSLRPGVPRLVQSIFLHFDPGGNLEDWRLGQGLLVSRAKLSYEAAESLIAGGEPEPSHFATFESEHSGESPWSALPAWEEVREPLRQALQDMSHLARLLRQNRFAAGSLDIDTPEYRVLHDARGRVVDIAERADLESYGLIEEFMLQANQAVARSLNDAGLPLLWRIHEVPEYQNVEELRRFLRKLGLHWEPENPATQRDYQRLLRAIERRTERRYLMYKVLRSLQKARYDSRHKPHFGLAFSHYTHFTSPIRRYPDLHNHRLLQSLLNRSERKATSRKLPRAAVGDLGRHTTDREIHAADAERASFKLKLCELLEPRIGEETDGFVSTLTDFGFYVDLPAWKGEGLVHVRDLGSEDFSIDPQRTVLRGMLSGRLIRFGQSVHVRLVRVDPDRRQIDLCLAD
jgi:ribonuclease R